MANLVEFHLSLNLLILFFKSCSAISNFPLFLLISYDGFRYDYLTKSYFPNFEKLTANGVRAQWVINTFQTKTIPNHHSIVTGMFQETHGMVGNVMHDPWIFNETFTLMNNESKWWNTGAEPIWVTNQKAEAGQRWSGSMMWFGSNVKINGHFPSRFETWDQNVPWHDRVDELIRWYLDPVNPINLGLLYIEEPDEAGHQAGPDSQLVLDTLYHLDEFTGYLMQQLEAYDLLDKLNIIFTSDHGMANIDESQIVNLDYYVNPSFYEAFDGSPVSNILPNEGLEDFVYQSLLQVPHLKVYKKEHIPNDYHYQHNRRIQPIVIEAEEGWMYTYNYYLKNMSIGAHGFNNSWAPMHPYFIAYGPAFKKNYVSPPFRNVDIYPLMCYLLEIEPQPNNGSLDNIRHILIEETVSYWWIKIAVLLLIAIAVSILLASRYLCREYYSKKLTISSIRITKTSSKFNKDYMESKEPLLLNEEP